MTQAIDEIGLDAWRAFITAHAAVIGAIETELAERNLIPLVWYDVLTVLSEVPGRRLRMGDLARRLVLTRSGATRLVDRLESAGLIARERAPEDRRGAAAVLTPRGAAALRKAWPVYAGGISRLFLAPLAPSEINLLATALARVRDHVDR